MTLPPLGENDFKIWCHGVGIKALVRKTYHQWHLGQRPAGRLDLNIPLLPAFTQSPLRALTD
jgi:hypothetical protein